MAKSSRAFTLVEVAALTAAAAIFGSLGLIAAGQPGQGQSALGKARSSARQLKDSTQLRGIHQAFVVWAQNNEDRYPLPSTIDKENFTVKEEGRAKDTSANIYSMIVYQGMVGPELLVSPLENNPAVKEHKDYKFIDPETAVKPEKALWDPALKVGLSKDDRGHVSYAHLQPAGGRLDAWSNTFNAAEVVLGNRGPEISKVGLNERGGLVPTLANPKSLALKHHGDGKVWAGHLVANDNHVEFVPRLLEHERFYSGEAYTYTGEGEAAKVDVVFFDEQDDAKSKNIFLGLFPKAGEKPAEYSSIWD